jgi:hypothetical protein
MNIAERLEIFFQRLKAAQPASSAEEALTLVCRLIEEVEDELCPLPRENPPPRLRFTGRMYAPEKDRVRRLEGGQLVATARRHRIYCQPSGAILIRDVHNNAIVLTKDGVKR